MRPLRQVERLDRQDGDIVKPALPGSCARMLVIAGLALMLTAPVAGSAATDSAEQPVVRLAVVNAPQQSGLLAYLLPSFEKTSGYLVEVYSGRDVFRPAESGAADIVLAHYGKALTEQFVLSGIGTWPRPVFSNQSVLVGPKNDPAKIRGMTDPFEAMRKIVASGSRFVAPSYPVGRYLSELLLAGAGNPERGAWYIESTAQRGRAMEFAEDEGAYTIWGSFPFQRFQRKRGTDLEVMVWNTPVFQRLMAVIVVNPAKFPGMNIDGARALEAYLLAPATQAAIAAFREDGLDRQTWWPAALDNNPAQILGLAGDEEDE
jgi:tungstate transport system substrate-binding protein